MHRNSLIDLHSFAAVAEESSFTKAAAKLAISQSALSHSVRRLETSLGIRLLTRTTRNVSLTEAGEKLFHTLSNAFQDIDNELNALVDFRDKPSGTIRINSSQHASSCILWPKIQQFSMNYPDVNIELVNNAAFVDIVGERFDAGVRLGESIDKDMVSVRISADMQMYAVAAPCYFERHPIPQTPHDLIKHSCINLRLPTFGGLYAWEFAKDGHKMNVRVNGRFVFNDTALIIDAALAGLGIGYVMADRVDNLIAEGKLIQVLTDWCPVFSGYHLYYPSRRQHTQAFKLLIDKLRYIGS